MKNLLSLLICCFIVIFIISCEKEALAPEDTSLSVMLIASSDEIIVGNSIEVSVDIKNADSLFALAFELNYNPDIFQVGSLGDTLSMGNLFEEPFPENSYMYYLDQGKISISFAEWGDIKETVTGTACSIVLSSITAGTGSFYISSIDLIQKNTSEINGYPPVVKFLDVLVRQE